jgi:hypothetical protein
VLKYLVDDLPLKFHEILRIYANKVCVENSVDARKSDEKQQAERTQKCKAAGKIILGNDLNAKAPPSFDSRKLPPHMRKRAADSANSKLGNAYKKPLIEDSVESACEEEPIDEVDDESDDEIVEESVENELLYNMAGGWVKDKEPDHSCWSNFVSATGPNHTLSDTATPLQYLALFIPLNLFNIWASYTNAYAAAVIARLKGSCRNYTPTCAAELKAFVASVIWMSVIKSMQLQDFWNPTFNVAVLRSWFPNFIRFQQLKRFFKVSDLNKDKQDENDRAAKVRDFFSSFLQRFGEMNKGPFALQLQNSLQKSGKTWGAW